MAKLSKSSSLQDVNVNLSAKGAPHKPPQNKRKRSAKSSTVQDTKPSGSEVVQEDADVEEEAGSTQNTVPTLESTLSAELQKRRADRRLRSSYIPSHEFDENDLMELECQTRPLGSIERKYRYRPAPPCDADRSEPPVPMHELLKCSERSWGTCQHASLTWRVQCFDPATERCNRLEAEKGKRGWGGKGNTPDSKKAPSSGEKPERATKKTTPRTGEKRKRSQIELPEDWELVITIRKEGKSAGSKDKHFVSPCGKRFRSLVQVEQFIAKKGEKSRPAESDEGQPAVAPDTGEPDNSVETNST